MARLNVLGGGVLDLRWLVSARGVIGLRAILGDFVGCEIW